MNGSDQIILIKLDIRISAGQQMFDDAACVCYYDVIIRRRVMDQLNRNQDQLISCLEAKEMKSSIFACCGD